MGDLLPAVTRPTGTAGPWETFSGAAPGTGPEDVTSRPLNTDGGRYDWPDPELTAGIALISIQAYGDQPGHAFVAVTGMGRRAVEAAHARTCQLVASGALVPLFQDPGG